LILSLSDFNNIVKSLSVRFSLNTINIFTRFRPKRFKENKYFINIGNTSKIALHDMYYVNWQLNKYISL